METAREIMEDQLCCILCSWNLGVEALTPDVTIFVDGSL